MQLAGPAEIIVWYLGSVTCLIRATHRILFIKALLVPLKKGKKKQFTVFVRIVLVYIYSLSGYSWGVFGGHGCCTIHSKNKGTASSECIKVVVPLASLVRIPHSGSAAYYNLTYPLITTLSSSPNIHHPPPTTCTLPIPYSSFSPFFPTLYTSHPQYSRRRA